MSIYITKNKCVFVRDPYSALTHFIGAIISLLVLAPLIIVRACNNYSNSIYIISLTVFIVSMILLYSASTIYHTFDLTSKINLILKKIDHMCIFLLIAGTYTPICVIVLNNKLGSNMLIAIWIIAIIGMCFNLFWITCPKWLSSIIYVAMGWLCMIASSQLFSSLSRTAFYWLLVGGIIYTVGGVIYALKLPIFNKKHSMFGSHEIFHIFVLVGSACHFVLMYSFVAKMPF